MNDDLKLFAGRKFWWFLARQALYLLLLQPFSLLPPSVLPFFRPSVLPSMYICMRVCVYACMYMRNCVVIRMSDTISKFS